MSGIFVDFSQSYGVKGQILFDIIILFDLNGKRTKCRPAN